VYVERSPLSHLATLSTLLVVLQGAEDNVVPPAQSEAILAALREKVPVAYRLYAGEQHGFRKAENIKDALQSELSFYAQVLGFELPAEEGMPTLEVENR